MKQGLLAYCFIPIFESNAFFFQFILVLLGSHNIWSPKVFCSNMEAFGAGVYMFIVLIGLMVFQLHECMSKHNLQTCLGVDFTL